MTNKIVTGITFFFSKIKLAITVELQHFYKYFITPIIEDIRKDVKKRWKEYITKKFTTTE